MTNYKTLAVDIDGCVLTQISDDWFYYLKAKYKFKEEFKHLKHNWAGVKLPYNLTELFDLSEENQDGFEFFRNAFLYDNYRPRDDAQLYLKMLSESGWDIVFVSKVMGSHALSKINFIEKWFPYAKACILTSEKQYIRCDALVDDYVVNLNKMSDGVDLYRFRLDYEQKEQASKPMTVVYNFEELYYKVMGDDIYE